VLVSCATSGDQDSVSLSLYPHSRDPGSEFIDYRRSDSYLFTSTHEDPRMVWEDDRGSSIFRAEEVRGGSLA
jgi:hypothetical protein